MKYFRILMLLIITCGFFYCNPAAPLTPQDSFYNVKKSFYNEDAEGLMSVMSQSTIKHFENLLFIIKKSDKKQSEYISKKYSTDINTLKKLNLYQYITIVIRYDKKQSGIWKALQQKIQNVEKNGNRAKIYLDNGMFLFFVKEGPYWKIDLTNM